MTMHLQPRTLITLPSASRPLLIFTPSLKRSPQASVFEHRSEPARSTKLNFDVVTDFLGIQKRRNIVDLIIAGICIIYFSFFVVAIIVSVNIAWDRDDVSFISVEAAARPAEPRSS